MVSSGSLLALCVVCCALTGAYARVVQTGSTERLNTSSRCEQNSVTALSCADVTSEDSLVPHPDDCQLFYYCVQPYLPPVCRECPANLHFNPVIHVCDWPSQAGCNVTTAPSNVTDAPSNATDPSPTETDAPSYATDAWSTDSDASSSATNAPSYATDAWSTTSDASSTTSDASSTATDGSVSNVTEAPSNATAASYNVTAAFSNLVQQFKQYLLQLKLQSASNS